MRCPFASIAPSIAQNNDEEDKVKNEVANYHKYLDMVITEPSIKGRYMDDLNRERYIISKHTHTSFTEIDEISYVERTSIMKYIMEDLEHTKQAQERASKNLNI